MEVNGYRQLFGYQHSSKYLICVQQKQDNLQFWNNWINDRIFILGDFHDFSL